MKQQILELEKDYWKAMESHRYEAVKKLTRFPCLVAGKNGVNSVDEPSFKKMFDSSKGNEMSVSRIYGEEVQVLDEQTAVMAYLIELTYTTDGKKTTMKCACSSTWVLENGSWLAAMHTETDIKE